MSTRNRLTAAALALVATLVVTAPASAVAPTTVDATPGVTAPAGMFRDTHGDLWVADSNLGICRVLDPPHANPGLVADPAYCGLARTTGPVAPGQSAYDPSSGFIYVGDLASNSGGVWRLHLDQGVNPSVIDSAVKILDLSAPLIRDRVFGMSYHASTKSLDFSTKNATNILRIDDPTTNCPGVSSPTCLATVIGSAESPATASLAHDSQGRLYIADFSGVTAFTPGSVDTQARSVPGLNLGIYTALAFDPDNGGRIYAGTTNAEGVDWIDVLQVNTAETATYSVGFDGVTAIGVDDTSLSVKGRLDVVDDPGAKQVGEDLAGTGRRFAVDFEDFAPAPQIIDGPPAIANVKVASFFFRYGSATTFHCSLDQAPATPCGAGTQGSVTYAGLPSGAHNFVLYASNPMSGPRTIRRFAIDTRAPAVSIDTTTIVGSAVEFGISADDLNVDLTCRMDGGAAGPCDTPARYAGLADGLHAFTVFATDFVGNVGAPVSTSFRIGLPSPPPPSWKAGKVTASLRGRTLRVVFNAPPRATFARFTLSKTSGVKVRTKIVRIKGGKRNIITIKLTRAEARRLQRQTVTLKATAGLARTALTTKAGQGRLKVVVRLAAGRR